MRSVLGPLSTIWKDNSGLDRLVFLFRGLTWQVRKRLGLSFVTRLASGANVQVHPSGAFSAVFYSRWLEPDDMLFVRTHAHLAPTFVDVGANCGLFSAQLFDKFSRFYLFEPAKSSFRALQETCALNPQVDCRAFNIAVSDEASDSAVFRDEGEFSTTGRLVDAGTDPADRGIYRVRARPLDNALDDLAGDIILKIDVEGGEEKVFRGARGLFSAQRVKLVLFERLGRTNIDNIISFMSSVGYEIFHVLPGGTVTRDPTAIRKPKINLFACPRAVFADLVGGRS